MDNATTSAPNEAEEQEKDSAGVVLSPEARVRLPFTHTNCQTLDPRPRGDK